MTRMRYPESMSPHLKSKEEYKHWILHRKFQGTCSNLREALNHCTDTVIVPKPFLYHCLKMFHPLPVSSYDKL